MAALRARCAVLLLALSLGALAPGCFSPQYGNGHLHCQQGPHPCPDDFRCVAGTCWRNGTEPPHQLTALAASGGGGVAVSARSAQLSLSACEVPVGGVVQSDSGATVTFGFLASSVE